MLNPAHTTELTVAAIIERDARFLMVEEWVGGRALLNQPAGHVEPGENILAACARETREETAWGFLPNAIVGVYKWEGNATRPCILRTVFCGACDAHAPEQALDDGIIAAHWLSYAQLAERPERLRGPLVLRALDDYLAGNRHPLHLMHHIDAT